MCKKPALQEAAELTYAARPDKLTWLDEDAIIAAVHEELQEVKTAENADHREEELGDVLWAVAGLACHYDIDPEKALMRSVDKFRRRWQKMRELAETDNIILAELDDVTLDSYWKRSKTLV